MPNPLAPRWLPWRRRIQSARVWREAGARQDAAEQQAAVWRIINHRARAEQGRPERRP